MYESFSRTTTMSERVLKMAYQSLTRIKSAITDSNEGGTSDKDDQEDLITFGPEFTEPVMRLLQTLKSMLDRPTPKVRRIAKRGFYLSCHLVYSFLPWHDGR